jgi:hypothetical protein
LEPPPARTPRIAPKRAILAGAALVVAVVSSWWWVGGSSRVVAVHPGSRLLAVSRGTLAWLGRTCSVWQAPLDGAHAGEPLEPFLYLAECPPDDPRVDGDVVYHLSGQGRVTRNRRGRRELMVERSLAYALALDARYLYVGNCAQAGNCQIERLPAEDEPGDAMLMQAGILALSNMDVDEREIFWVDRGRRKPECRHEPGAGDSVTPALKCKDPVPPRLMAATKDEPRAVERVVLGDFDGRRPLLGAGHVYWLGAGGLHRVAKSGGANQLVLATRDVTGFAADGDQIFVAADAGIFRGRDGGDLRAFQSTASPPRGVAVDAGYVYWIDGEANAVMRRRR